MTARINGELVPVGANETVLDAALRQGFDFPHACRVGGCGTCKCRLLEGQVTELTETAYLLSAEEIRQGYILGCQSVPTSDVRIDVDLPRDDSMRLVSGRVTGQQEVTHDITRLTAQLDEGLAYRSGQFARISFDALAGIERCYSFAAPPRSDGVVEFLIRKLPGGLVSSLLDERDLIGATLRVEGPLGDLWLRPSPEPILMVAGGSGLSPLLAML
jgi:ferredoxin